MKLLKQPETLFFILFTLVSANIYSQTPWFNYENTNYQHVHDPSVFRDTNGVYTLISTNNTLLVRQSDDMRNWRHEGNIVNSVPNWVNQSLNTTIENLWAPHITYAGGKYWAYYCGSSFGTNNSVIGVASNPTLDPYSPNYNWTDHGEVIRTGRGNNYNAIDPELIIDNDGKWWLAFGSFWDGIRLVEIDPQTGKRKSDSNTVYAIASRGGGAIEGPSIIEHNGYYYLFTAWDKCCDGLNSTYRTMVGRSQSITGPYVDKQGRSLMNGYAEEFIASYDRFIGTGGGSAFKDGRKAYFAHHYYNGNENGFPRLQIREIIWDNEGWPVASQPYLGRRQAYEAEHAEVTNAQLTEGNNQASNRAYVGYINEADSKVKFVVNPFQAGEYKLRIRYAAGMGEATHTLQINTGPETDVFYSGTSAWGQFPEGQFVEVPVILNEGYNTITLGKGTGFAELDRIDLIRSVSEILEAGSADDGVLYKYQKQGNKALLYPEGWIKFEYLQYEEAGVNRVNLSGDCKGVLTIANDGLTGSVSAELDVDFSGNYAMDLPTAFNTLTGNHDVYIQYSGSESCLLDDIEFVNSVVTNQTAASMDNTIKVYPNPFGNDLKVEIKEAFEFLVHDLSGNVVAEGACTGECKILADVSPGLYFLTIKVADDVKRVKVEKFD